MASVEQVTRTGVYSMPHEAYLADPVPGGSLSASGARLLLPPSCPAKFRHALENPRPSTRDQRFGTVAHGIVLGDGPDVAVIEAPDYRSKAAREERDGAIEAGRTPILESAFEVVMAMAEALRAHPVAGALLDPARGERERSLFWVDKPSGVWRRARIDLLPHRVEGWRTVVADYKTAASADPERFARAAMDYGYHVQAAWYRDAVRAVRGDEKVEFVFIVQEKTEPYLVSVIQLAEPSMRIGEALGRHAIGIYKQCVRSGEWPGYGDDIEYVSLPGWYENRMMEEYGE